MASIKIELIEGWPIQEVETDALTQEQAQKVMDIMVDKLEQTLLDMFAAEIMIKD
jgi:hypothetical protein